MMHSDRNERLIELLIDNATVGLAPEERSELEQYGSEGRVSSESDLFELAAAAADLAFYERAQVTMPSDLRDRLLFSAGQELDIASGNDAPKQQRMARAKVELRPKSHSKLSWREIASLLVAAACLLILVVNFDRIVEPASSGGGGTVVQLSPQTSQELYQQIETELGSTYSRPSWHRGPSDPDEIGLGASGDLVWDQKNQRGVMRFQDLPINDPSVQQYQLWIFEAGDQAHPIDGGVFDITKSDEYIPIDAKIGVGREPVLFAITIEKPGGVVVSDRSRLPLWTVAPSSLP